MRAYILLFLTFVITLTSCENELDYVTGKNDSKLVINALINSNSAENKIYVSNSGGYGATAEPNAIVKVFVNNVLKETVDQCEPEKSDEPEQYTVASLYLINCKFEVNDIVKIDVTTKNGEKHAWGEVKVLPNTPIEKIEVSDKLYASNVLGRKNHIQLDISINDIPNEDNYYRLIAEQYIVDGEAWNNNEHYINYKKAYAMYIDTDIVLMDGSPMGSSDEMENGFQNAYNCYGIFNDKYYKNSSCKLTVSIPHSYDLDYIILKLVSISKEEYLYYKYLNVIDSDIFGENFSEPASYDSNVNGGLGIVGISSESSQKIQIREKRKYNTSSPHLNACLISKNKN